MYVSMVTLNEFRIQKDLKNSPRISQLICRAERALKLIFRKNSQVISTANHSFQFQPEKSMGKKTDLSSIRAASLHPSL